MKQLTCEMCGSTDLIKQDGVFVCQSCGCKYSVEEAKKIFSEKRIYSVKTLEKRDTTDSQTLPNGPILPPSRNPILHTKPHRPYGTPIHLPAPCKSPPNHRQAKNSKKSLKLTHFR